MKVTLVSPYEIGRQPFALAQPAAWLRQAGFEVACIDLSVERLEMERVAGSQAIGFHLAMHAGARLAAQIIPSVAQQIPNAEIFVFGLYAPVNAEYFRSLGAKHAFGGESEADILSLCRGVQDGDAVMAHGAVRVSLEKLDFTTPCRDGLPDLELYSRLAMPDGSFRTTGFAEASRGCKHVCRHCPVVPVYNGSFRVVAADAVLDDIRQQVESGAKHISFGDPDFLNGPTHARRIVERMHSKYPDITWDATIKIEHLLKHEGLIRQFADMRCLFITSAVESVEDDVLARLDKGHTAADFINALQMMRSVGVSLAPTFVPFTPWTTLSGYCRLLRLLAKHQLVNSVAPVQLAIRLLLPKGSRLLELDDRELWLGTFDPQLLGYRWRHSVREVDELQERVMRSAMDAEERGLSRQETFEHIWNLAHAALGTEPPSIPAQTGGAPPQMTEPWYCCAEPTEAQLRAVM